MLVRPLSTVDNTRDYARVSHSRQWSNYNVYVTANSTAANTLKHLGLRPADVNKLACSFRELEG